MPLDIDSFQEPVRGILRKYSTVVLPLTRTGSCNGEDAANIQRAAPDTLFSGARAPEAAVSGLLLLLSCWHQSHELSQEIGSPEGSYWHAIVHRMEPDSLNSAYWFRQVGEHQVFPELNRRASEILRSGDVPWPLKPAWDPFLFIEWCDEARQIPGSDKEDAALKIQQAEWQLLFDWCARAARVQQPR